MTPREKAIELIAKFDDSMEYSTPSRFAKKSALVALNEMHEFAVEYMSHENLILALADIEEIRQEIQKL